MSKALLAVGVLAIVAIILIDRRVRSAGALFTALATPPMRLLALLLGLVFAGLAMVQFSIEWLIVSVALTTYGLGVPIVLKRLQQDESHHESRAAGRRSAFLMAVRRWGILIAALGAAVLTAAWILARGESGQTLLVVLVIALPTLGGVVGLLLELGFLSDIVKRLFK